MPMTVMVLVPAAAPAATARFSVDAPEPVMVSDEKEAATPLGNPLALSVTPLLQPSMAEMVAVVFAEFPACTLSDAGAAAMAKSGCALALPTSSVAVAERVSAPEVPVMVSGYAPSAAEAPMATLSVWTLPLPVKLFFEPAGRPLTLKTTAPAKPLTGVTVRP